MNPIIFALRRPYSVLVAITAVALCALLALSGLLPLTVRQWLPVRGLSADIFPDLGVPIIYVAQPYGGMDPGQMEGFLTNYYEYHFLYITGIHHVESKNIQGVALMKLFFHPGTNMAQAMAETVNYVNRSQSFMPPGTVPPFIMRFDAGGVPVGYLVFESKTKSISEIQDAALFRVRPMFATLPGVSAPPPFGGNQRSIIVAVKPETLRAYGMSPEEVVAALSAGNRITPSGSVTLGARAPMVAVNSVVTNPQDLLDIVIRPGAGKSVYLRDLATVQDAADVATGYGLVNGRRSVYILVTKRADASTLAVVNEVKANLPRMKSLLPEGIDVRFAFDQSGYITRALAGVGLEGLLGAALTGLMVLLFLRDWRSVLVVVLNIPLALLGAVFALWLSGQTINLMTLGGLALAVGILVDEATVEVENIHTQLARTGSVARAVRLGNAETAVPRLLAMLCVLAVFVPTFFMQGSARALFVPLSLAVGFAMLASYLLSSTFVPVASVWLLRHVSAVHERSAFARLQDGYGGLLRGLVRVHWLVLVGYAGVVALAVAWGTLGHPGVGLEIFPQVDAGQFQLRLRAPDGTPLERTEDLARDVLDAVGREVGEDNVAISVTLVGTASYNYPINSIFLWTAGPQEAVLRIALRPGSGLRVEDLKTRLRAQLPQLVRSQEPAMKDVKLSFEAGDIVEEVMSFGAPNPVEVAVSGPNFAQSRAFAARLRELLARDPHLVDLHYAQSLDYPTLDVQLDRALLGRSGGTVADVADALPAVTLSSRFVARNFWRDPKSGIGYQVQVQLAPDSLASKDDLGLLPVHKRTSEGNLLLRDVATITEGTMPGEYDRYNMRRLVSLTANVSGTDLGRVAEGVARAVHDAGPPPTGVAVDVRGQIVPMRQMFGGLAAGLVLAVVVILLLLTANFQSPRLALVVVSTVPATVAGVAAMLAVTRTTLNVQSFMGAIMAVGVSVANAILLVTFAEKHRRAAATAAVAAVEAGRQRLRPILMTSFAMIAGMVPMALALGEGGEQTAPLARAVIGGLLAATGATLTVLPVVFAAALARAPVHSVSLDPDDPASTYFETARG